MPVVTIKLFEGRTREQKAELAKRITDDIVEVMGAAADHTWVFFEDSARSDVAIAGELQDDVS
ncbi:MAG: 4-oxalocrotonate tautomerase family protein [Thermoleophilaceae bacterium]|nr:4-oxalocrotonate tautomerase family protein [Thermoleophilaceae bacterium]